MSNDFVVLNFMAKRIAEETKNISMRWLKINGYLDHKRSYHSGIIQWKSETQCKDETKLSILTTDLNTPQERTFVLLGDSDKEDMNQLIELTTTPCHFGGKRLWFSCSLFKNNQYCGRRAAVFYSTGKYFGCRSCANIVYASQSIKRTPRYRLYNSFSNIEKLENKIKRSHYKGKETKKYRKLLKLNDKLENDSLVTLRFLNKQMTKMNLHAK